MNEFDRKELNLAINAINYLMDRLDSNFPNCDFGELKFAVIDELAKIQAQRAADESTRD